VLFKLSFMITLIGLLFLLVLSNFSEPERVSISLLKKELGDYLNKEVKVQGFVLNFKSFESGDVLFDIGDLNDSFEVRGSFSNSLIKNNDYCEIIGVLKEYNSKYFIDATSIKIG